MSVVIFVVGLCFELSTTLWYLFYHNTD